MPVERYRSIEEMNAAPIRVTSADSFERFIRLCRRYRLLAPKRYPRGVLKFRTIEEAQAARERVARESRTPSS